MACKIRIIYSKDYTDPLVKPLLNLAISKITLTRF